uniref:Uncharacterized protein n=1 Tax=Glossina pallidipes TaxID=7398 RepID=A0A1A9ZDA0_GLOPL
MKISLKISKQFSPLPVGIGLEFQSGFENAFALEDEEFLHEARVFVKKGEIQVAPICAFSIECEATTSILQFKCQIFILIVVRSNIEIFFEYLQHTQAHMASYEKKGIINLENIYASSDLYRRRVKSETNDCSNNAKSKSSVERINPNFTRLHHLLRDNRSFRDLKRLNIIYPIRSTRESRNFVDTLMGVTRGINLKIDRPTEVIIHDEHYLTYVRDREKYCRHHPQLPLCLMPNLPTMLKDILLSCI